MEIIILSITGKFYVKFCSIRDEIFCYDNNVCPEDICDISTGCTFSCDEYVYSSLVIIIEVM